MRLEYKIVVIVILVVVSVISIDKIINKIGCDENGGRWIGVIGCNMGSLQCEASGGYPVPGCMNTASLACYSECRFGLF